VTDAISGYQRSTGRWGVRNHVLILPARTAANLAAERIAAGLPGVVAIAHQWEAMPGDPDAARISRTLTGFGANPNVAATVIVGVTGDDRPLADAIAAEGQRVEFLALAQHRGTAGTVAAGRPVAERLRAEADRVQRQAMPLEELILGTECGGSDALSGITANPALGVASDLLVAAGGTSFLAEIPELIGAEHLLAARAVSPEVAQEVLDVIRRFEEDIRNLGVDVRGAQPTPGNIEGGLTTIEEKSLGAAKKGGNAPVSGVAEFAARPRGRGLFIMDTPGHDIEQMVGMVAGGAQIVVFTTGRGTPTGSPIAPCIKVATNSAMFARLHDDIDLNAGAILDGAETLESMGRMIYNEILAVASGKLSSAERRGNREFAISRTSSPMALMR
jgi:altronate dehydratase large subunit